MDGDLQDHPEDIPLLYAKLREGHEVVYGVREWKNESALRNLVSRTFV
jgi:polyisoprenyl-phosphate glycosyltransferase